MKKQSAKWTNKQSLALWAALLLGLGFYWGPLLRASLNEQYGSDPQELAGFVRWLLGYVLLFLGFMAAGWLNHRGPFAWWAAARERAWGYYAWLLLLWWGLFELLQGRSQHDIELAVENWLAALLGTDFMRLNNDKALSFIFTTAYEQYAVEGFELQALDYLLKPIAFQRFAQACNRALRQRQAHLGQAQYLFVKDGHDWVRIDLPDLYYVKSDGNLLFIYQRQGMIVTRMTLGNFLEMLPAELFIRTHKSYIAAKQAIRKIERHQLTMTNGDKVPIARSYRPEVEQRLIG